MPWTERRNASLQGVNAAPSFSTARAFDSRALSGRFAGALNSAVVMPSISANGPPCAFDSAMTARAMLARSMTSEEATCRMPERSRAPAAFFRAAEIRARAISGA